MSIEEENMKKGIKIKSSSIVLSEDLDHPILQRCFKQFIISVSKFSDPPMRKKALLKEIEVLLEQKCKYRDRHSEKLIKSFYRSHKSKDNKHKFGTTADIDKEKSQKYQKTHDEDFQDCKNVLVEGEKLGNSDETKSNNLPKMNENDLDMADIGIESQNQHDPTTEQNIDHNENKQDKEPIQPENKEKSVNKENDENESNGNTTDFEIPMQEGYEDQNWGDEKILEDCTQNLQKSRRQQSN